MKLYNEFAFMFYNAVIKKGKKLIIGGYDLNGVYCNWLIRHITDRNADMILDVSLCVYGVKIYRELSLTSINPDEYLGIVVKDKEYAEIFKRNGIECVFLKEVFGSDDFGFYQWLEHEKKVDLVATIPKEEFDYDYSCATNSGPSRQMGLADVLYSLETHLPNLDFNMKALDVGCGKGSAMVMLSQSFLFSKVDGIELSRGICEIARQNMDKLKIDANVMNVSATEFDRYHEYDLLYLYDPFRGDVFKKTLRMIEEATLKRDKPMYLVYANPYHHKDIENGGVFQPISAIDTDFFHRDVYIYSSGVQR